MRKGTNAASLGERPGWLSRAVHSQSQHIGVWFLHALNRGATGRKYTMALQHIFNLNNSIGARTIHCLYFVALVLIGLMVLFGLIRGVRTMMRTPPPPRPVIAQ